MSVHRGAMLRLIAQTPDPLLAALSGMSEAEDLAAYRAGWAEWVEDQPAGTAWLSASQCHRRFTEHLARAVGPDDLSQLEVTNTA